MATNTPGTDARYYHTAQVHYLRKRITFEDTSEVEIGEIPAGSSVIGGGVHVITAFNSATSDTLDVGFKDGNSTDDPNAYATLLDLTAVGFIALDELAATTNIQQTEDHLVTATVTSAGGSLSAGVADVIVEFVVDNDQ